MQKTIVRGGHNRGAGPRGEGRVIQVKGLSRIKRVLVTFMSIIAFVMAASFGPLVKAVYAEGGMEIPEVKPVYTPNKRMDVMVARLMPGASNIELSYRKQNPNDGRRPIFVSLWYGELTDYELYNLRDGDVPGRQLIYKSMINDLVYTGMIHDSMPIWPSLITEGGLLMQNKSSRIDYVVIYDNGDVEHARASYERCTGSSLFARGFVYECVLEETDDGRLVYQPYDSLGQRLEISPEEDVMLRAKDEAWRAVTGWPDEEGTVEGEESDVLAPDVGNDDAAESAVVLEQNNGRNVALTMTSEHEEGSWLNNAGYVAVTGVDADEPEASNNNFEQISSSSDVSLSDGDDVGVPNLSKETERRANILQPILYVIVSTAAIFGWWFLFFGKRKNNKKGEGKK